MQGQITPCLPHYYDFFGHATPPNHCSL